jgi:hypothetical protein
MMPPPPLPLLRSHPLLHLPLLRLPPLLLHLPPLSSHPPRPRLRCRHRRPTPTLQARLLASLLSPRTSLPLLLSPATLPLLTTAMRRSARCSMSTRTKSVSILRFFCTLYIDGGKTFRGQDVRGRGVGDTKNNQDMQIAVLEEQYFTTRTPGLRICETSIFVRNLICAFLIFDLHPIPISISFRSAQFMTSYGFPREDAFRRKAT